MKLPPGYVPGVGVTAPTAKGGFGERLLRRLGWADGEGLGKARQGRAEAVVVTKKADTAGIGVDPAAPAVDWGDKWWEGAYAKAAASVRTDTAAATSSSSSSDSEEDGGRRAAASSSSSSSSSDDDDPAHAARLAEAVGGAPPSAPSSRRRSLLNGDGTAATGTAAELAIAAALATSARSTPRGGATFGGRAGKLARLRAQEAELAGAAREKLHGSGGAGRAAPPPPLPAAKRAKKQVAAAAAPLPSPPTPPPQPQLGPAPTPPPPGWWGAGRFVWAGPLGGAGAEAARARAGAATAAATAAAAAASKKPRGFSEADQADLMERAEAGKSSGRRGLGAKKGGGGGGGGGGLAWEGTKKTFDEDEEVVAGPALDTTAHELAPPPPAQDASLPKKWKAAVAAALGRAAKGRLPPVDLAAAVGACPAALGAAVAASSRFTVDKKGRVTLQAGGDKKQKQKKKKKKSKA